MTNEAPITPPRRSAWAQVAADNAAWAVDHPGLDPRVWHWAPANRQELLRLAREADLTAAQHEQHAAADRALAAEYRKRADSLKGAKTTDGTPPSGK